MIDDNIQTLCLDLPTTIQSYVVSNRDGSYTVVLNARLCREQLLSAYVHAINHLFNGDYDKTCSADLIEIHAHQDPGRIEKF